MRGLKPSQRLRPFPLRTQYRHEHAGVSPVAALAAAVQHIRAGRIDWRLFAWMAPPSMVGAAVGGLVSGSVPENALLLAIGVTLLVFGVDLLRPRPRKEAVGEARIRV